MALSSATIWEVRNVADFAGASDINGGGFVAGASGTDYSFASLPSGGAAKYTLTNGVTNGTTTVATASASADMVGNIAYISGGTGSVVGNWYQIISQTTGVSIVVDRATGLTTGTGVGITVGGCFATPGVLTTVMTVSTMAAWIKYSTTPFTLTTSTAGTGGPISIAAAIFISGYDSTRGDSDGNRPQIAWPSSGVTVGSAAYVVVVTGTVQPVITNLYVNCNSVTNVGGYNLNSNAAAIGCVCQNANGTGSVAGFFQVAIGQSCFANNCLVGFATGLFVGCFASNCTSFGFKNGILSLVIKCVASACGTGFGPQGQSATCECTADSCTTGFSVTGSRNNIVNCVASNNTTGYNLFNVSPIINCAAYNNTTNVSGGGYGGGTVTVLTAQPFVTAGSQFAPNSAAGGGAALRGAALGVYGQTDNTDIGAVQHADPSGGTSGLGFTDALGGLDG